MPKKIFWRREAWRTKTANVPCRLIGILTRRNAPNRIADAGRRIAVILLIACRQSPPDARQPPIPHSSVLIAQ
jgi:hypothetical protein